MSSRQAVSIAGLGNIEKRDDGVGVLVVEGLREELDAGAWVPEAARDIAVVPAGMDSLLAAAHAVDGRWVILVDAAHMGLPPASFECSRPAKRRSRRAEGDCPRMTRTLRKRSASWRAWGAPGRYGSWGSRARTWETAAGFPGKSWLDCPRCGRESKRR